MFFVAYNIFTKSTIRIVMVIPFTQYIKHIFKTIHPFQKPFFSILTKTKINYNFSVFNFKKIFYLIIKIIILYYMEILYTS